MPQNLYMQGRRDEQLVILQDLLERMELCLLEVTSEAKNLEREQLELLSSILTSLENTA